MPEHIVVLSGAGMSAESGIRTFRDNNGLWEDHDVMEVASPAGWAKDPALVNRFYNARRAQLFEVKPNAGHFALAELDAHYRVNIITQNVDDLHERAGSTNVLHLHGELRKVRSQHDETYILDWKGPLSLDDKDPDGYSLRPHIVWFGEQVPAMESAIPLVQAADIIIIIGTSMQVYPAAGLIDFARENAIVYYINPAPAISQPLSERANVHVIAEPAGYAVPSLVSILLNNL